MHGRAEIEKVFSDFLTNFHTVYHLNGQHTVEINGDTAQGINYCQVTLIGNKDGGNEIQTHGVRYQDSYVKQNGSWLIKKRIANFMFSDVRLQGQYDEKNQIVHRGFSFGVNNG